MRECNLDTVHRNQCLISAISTRFPNLILISAISAHSHWIKSQPFVSVSMQFHCSIPHCTADQHPTLPNPRAVNLRGQPNPKQTSSFPSSCRPATPFSMTFNSCPLPSGPFVRIAQWPHMFPRYFLQAAECVL